MLEKGQIITILFIILFSVSKAQDIDYLISNPSISEYTEDDKRLLDSCLEVYHTSTDLIEKFQALEVVCDNLWHQDWTRYNAYMIERLEEVDVSVLNDEERTEIIAQWSNAYNNKGFDVMDKGNMKEALLSYEKAKNLAEQIDRRDLIATTLNNMGYAYEHIGNVEMAVECIMGSIRIREEEAIKDGLNSAYINLGYIYFSQDDFEKAEEYFSAGLEISKEIGDTKGEATSLNNLGKLYDLNGDDEKAIDYFSQSLALKEKLGDKAGMVMTYINIGQLNLEQGNDEKSLDVFAKALKLAQELQFKEGIWGAEFQYALYYFEKEDFDKSHEMAKECMSIARELAFPEQIFQCAQLLSKITEKKGLYKESLQWHKEYSIMKDSIYNENLRESTVKKELKYEFEKQQLAMIKEQEKKDLLAEQESIRQRNLTAYVFVGFLLLVVFTISLYNRFRLISSQKEIIENQKIEVESKNAEINSSISYAKRIQEAILPPLSLVKKNLNNSFIVYMPKDIVAGDFYWLEAKGDDVFFAAADCTGHGVPGAMVSVVCANALNRAVNEMELREPAKILDKVRDLVVETFEKSEEEVKDGMDIAFCKLNLKNRTLSFAGAHNSLYHITKKEGEITDKTIADDKYMLQEYKGDKQPIGKYAFLKPFNQHKVNLKEGDSIYISSDGYADQFGGEKGRKFMYKPFKNLLLSLHEQNPEDQKMALIESFKNWKGEKEQVDDVCIIGVRL